MREIDIAASCCAAALNAGETAMKEVICYAPNTPDYTPSKNV